ncbi:MAG: hypothetical protein LBJ00_03520 [Planctomycetaceae bacterium]|nr:hypothetical protein [Planctomycetaceae bacterium]
MFKKVSLICRLTGRYKPDNTQVWFVVKKYNIHLSNCKYIVADKAIGFTLEQSLHVVTFACPA